MLRNIEATRLIDIVWYLQWSMKKELRDLQTVILKRAAEATHP